MATWQSKLTKKHMKHLREMGMNTLSKIKTTLEHQAETRKDPENISDPCWTCREVANRLNLPV